MIFADQVTHINPDGILSSMDLGDSLDTNHGVYSRAVFTTEVVMHLEVIIQGQLL